MEPGETATIEVNWTAHVPRTFARTGAIGSYFFVAQWFPKLGVLEENGWNTHQFHAGTEFFSDYGVYDVRLTVPQDWIVGATGIERERQNHPDGTTTHHYYQEDVHDFAWTTSPDYIERTAVVETGAEKASKGAIQVRLLLQPEHRDQAERYLEAARVALTQFTNWFGAYAYPQLTIVDAAYQSGTGGMEYPTLVTTGTSWLVPRAVTINTPEEVTIHEIGHQWWYGIVGSNEFEHAWMDEGLTTYTTARAMGEGYPATYLEHRYFGGLIPWAFREIRLARETYWNRLAGYRLGAKSDLPSAPSYEYSPFTGNLVTYNKTALWLNTMERWLGWPVMQQILSTYFARWQFKHPKPQDFFDVATEVTGRDLSRFFDQVYQTSNVFDYGVQSLESTREGDRFRTTVIVRRYGEAIFPVDLRVTFESGEPVIEQWNGEDRWKLYTYERDSRARSAQRRSRPRAAARRELHEQLANPRTGRVAGCNEMGAEVDGLAGGPAFDVGVARMRWAGALRDGHGRVAGAPALVVGVWLLTVLASVPLTLAVRGSIESHLGTSVEADAVASGVNYDWMQEFSQQASGVNTTLTPNVLGFAIVLDNFSAWLDRQARPQAIWSAGVVYLLIWLFLAGGIIDRYARGRPTRAHGFFSVSGVFFFRFLRLALMAGFVYVVMFSVVHPWLFGTVYTALTRNMTVERTTALTRLGFYLLFGGTLAIFNLLFDYAKVRAVVEDRRSMIAAVVAAMKFLSRNGRSAIALYLINLVLLAAVLAVYRADGARRRLDWLVHVGGPCARTGLCRCEVVGEVIVLGVGNGALPKPTRPRRLCGSAGATLARVAECRGHRTIVLRLLVGRTSEQPRPVRRLRAGVDDAGNNAC